MDKEERRNMILLVALSTLILLGWNYFFVDTAPSVPAAQTTLSSSTAPEAALAPTFLTKSDALKSPGRLIVDTPTLTGTIQLTGARFDDVTFKNYRESTDPNSPRVSILEPYGTEKAYYGEFGWVSSTKSVSLPDGNTIWTADHDRLTVDTPVTLSWENGQGLVFQQILSVDKEYLITVTQRVISRLDTSVQLQAYGLISRSSTPETADMMILHEGPVGYLNKSLIEEKYKDLKDKPKTLDAVGGWMGITDKYWLVSMIPDQRQSLTARFRDTSVKGDDRYQTDYVLASQTLDAGAQIETITHFFVGPKLLDMLDGYEAQLGVEHFDKAVDFGWFYFLTKPIFYILTKANDILGNFGLAIMLLTIVLKGLFFPLANKSFRSMARMKALQPEMEKLKALYGDDKIRMNQELMDLYKKQGANPMAGCLPMVIQIPVFFALYKVLYVSIEMRQAPFYGWVHDLSIPDPTSLFNLFGLIPWAPPSFLMIGLWPLAMGLTMILQQKLNPAPTDPIQAKIFMVMPFMFTFMFAQFPAGLLIYWTWNNILTMTQQWFLLKMDSRRPAVVLAPTKQGAKKPKNKS